MKSLIIVALIAASNLALAAKSYQVTGTVLDVTASTIVVDKKGEKFEIALPAGTKTSGGEVKKGAKITVYYTMTATETEVKAETEAKAKKKK